MFKIVYDHIEEVVASLLFTVGSGIYERTVAANGGCIGLLRCRRHNRFSISIDPICCSAFRRGTVISAVLSWSPMSSDCAFTPEGRSVSSRYTFPYGLGSAFSVKK